jgi:hypothetical protein
MLAAWGLTLGYKTVYMKGHGLRTDYSNTYGRLTKKIQCSVRLL